MSPSTGTNLPISRFWRAVHSMPLWARLALAVVSASSYCWIQWLVVQFDHWSGSDLGGTAWPSHMIAAVFGALVIGPYAGSSRLRAPRIAAMCIASAAIYFFATKFVVDGPFSYNTITPYLISGAGAALLTGFTVAVLAPCRLQWRLVVLTVVAGLIGGGTFEWIPSGGSDFAILGGHFVWQVLVCLALHLGLRHAPAQPIDA